MIFETERVGEWGMGNVKGKQTGNGKRRYRGSISDIARNQCGRRRGEPCLGSYGHDIGIELLHVRCVICSKIDDC